MKNNDSALKRAVALKEEERTAKYPHNFPFMAMDRIRAEERLRASGPVLWRLRSALPLAWQDWLCCFTSWTSYSLRNQYLAYSRKSILPKTMATSVGVL